MSDRDVKIAIVRNAFPDEYHAVAAARVNGEWLILDNRWLTLVRDTDMRRAIPQFVLDENGVNRLVKPDEARSDGSRSISAVRRLRPV